MAVQESAALWRPWPKPSTGVLLLFLAAVLSFCSVHATTAIPHGPALKNILMIVIDDLRPQLGCYGAEPMRNTTPNIDRLAADGVMFQRAYVQQAICSPTRNSFLSGRTPLKTKVWNFLNHFREPEIGINWTALPQFFRDKGYYTTGAGKVYHPNFPPNFDNNKSWSVPWPGSFGRCGCGGHGWPPGGQASCEGLDPSTLSCQDEDVVAVVRGQLARATNGSLPQPFLIAAGLHKPHLPFYAPQHLFDLYPDPALPTLRTVPDGAPDVAHHSCLSNRPGLNNSNWGQFTDIPNAMSLRTPMSVASTKRLRRGYYASVSYTDSNVGHILEAAAPLFNSTIVVLIGDHGWDIGEGNRWCKMHEYENSVRVPLIIRAPWVQKQRGMKVAEVAAAVDLYKTLADLSGLGVEQVESGVDGVSLAPLVRGLGPGEAPPRTVATSQFPRCYSALNATAPSVLPYADRTDCQDVPRTLFDYMGYSIRTKQWRLTEWRHWDRAKLQGRWDIPAAAVELYNHTHDLVLSPGDVFGSERRNVASESGAKHVLAQLSETLRKAFHEQDE
eukprot:m.51540 g.51540  ORF g.51540 m.51540 type:complete len:557 (-) comp12232_c0_seq1:27-1697(-)